MAVITCLNPKGGSGKTTTTLLISTELSRRGAEVCIVDADPMRWVSKWAELPGKPDTIHVLNDITADNIVDKLQLVAEQFPFVIVDLEGSASVLGSYSVALSDLVLTPLQPSSMDAEAAGQAFAMVNSQSKLQKRHIQHSVVLTRTSAVIVSRDMKAIKQQLNLAGVDVLPTAIVERAAYRALFAYGGTLGTLDPNEVSNLPKAQANSEALTGDVIVRLNRG